MSIKVEPIANTRNPNLPATMYEVFVDGKKIPYWSGSEEVAYLLGLGWKYDGANSQFAHFACRMLRLKSDWA